MIKTENITRIFRTEEVETVALNGVSIEVNDGEFVAIMGPSGCGKSTLLNILGLLDSPTEGKYWLGEEEVGHLKERERTAYRKGHIGFVFQSFNLIDELTVEENIELQLKYLGVEKKERKQRVLDILRKVKLSHRMKHYPHQLSGGQQQRVAIARALTTHPKILLCDEATSALDPQTTQSILSLIRDIHDKLGITVIVITHQMSVVEQICSHVAILDNGEVVEEGLVSEVFAAPKSKAARHLVFPEGYEQGTQISGDNVIRVVFNGAKATNTPLIAQMAIDEGITASILSASTKGIGDKAYGNIILGIPGGENELARAMKYLKAMPDIFVEEVKNDE